VTETEAERREIYYSGRVQGVGFRYTANSLALRFVVSGYVRNLPNGSVELVIEGQSQEIEAFLSAIRTEMAGYIHSTEESVGPASGRFKGFSIRF
jgi:acylphosphatase